MYDYPSYNGLRSNEVGLKSNIYSNFDATEFIAIAVPIGNDTINGDLATNDEQRDAHQDFTGGLPGCYHRHNSRGWSRYGIEPRVAF